MVFCSCQVCAGMNAYEGKKLAAESRTRRGKVMVFGEPSGVLNVWKRNIHLLILSDEDEERGGGEVTNQSAFPINKVTFSFNRKFGEAESERNPIKTACNTQHQRSTEHCFSHIIVTTNCYAAKIDDASVLCDHLLYIQTAVMLFHVNSQENMTSARKHEKKLLLMLHLT